MLISNKTNFIGSTNAKTVTKIKISKIWSTQSCHSVSKWDKNNVKTQHFLGQTFTFILRFKADVILILYTTIIT